MKPTLKTMRGILAGAAEAITAPIGNVSKDTPSEYLRHLDDIDVDLLQASVDYCIENESAFFPSIYAIREASKAIISLAMGIPSPAEAWAMVLNAKTKSSAVYCEAGAEMRDGMSSYVGGSYLSKIRDWASHVESCDICQDAHDIAVYNHKAVESTVRVLGGRDGLFTGNMSSDRARFIEAYKEIVERELRMATLSPSIRGAISGIEKKMLVDGNIKMLSERLAK